MRTGSARAGAPRTSHPFRLSRRAPARAEGASCRRLRGCALAASRREMLRFGAAPSDGSRGQRTAESSLAVRGCSLGYCSLAMGSISTQLFLCATSRHFSSSSILWQGTEIPFPQFDAGMFLVYKWAKHSICFESLPVFHHTLAPAPVI